jgi:hypothetical protein
MKVVINTQYKENYGSEAEPYWKFKGGSTYIIAASDREDADKIVELGMPTLTSMIESRNSMYEEYIVGTSIQADSAPIYEDWETPTQLEWKHSRWGNCWTAARVTENGEYGYMRIEISRKIETWDMMMNSQRDNYVCTYVMRDGRIVKASDMAVASATV